MKIRRFRHGKPLPYEQMDIDKMCTRNKLFAGGAKGNSYDKETSPSINDGGGGGG